MKVIGLCGGSGSGKGAVCRIFLENGIPSIDTDAVYRELTSAPSECLTALAKEFGDEIIDEHAGLDRRRLSTIVFCGEGSQERLSRLNGISHKYILDETRRRLDGYREMNTAAAIVDAPLLFESGFDRECEVLICVVADKDRRTERIMKRDSISKEAAEQRIASQISDDELISRCDLVIRNDLDLDHLRDEVRAVLEQIL